VKKALFPDDCVDCQPRDPVKALVANPNSVFEAICFWCNKRELCILGSRRQRYFPNPMSASPAKIAARLLSRYAKVGIKLMQPFTAKEAALPTRWLRQPSASQLDQKEQGRIGYSHFVLVQGEEIQ